MSSNLSQVTELSSRKSKAQNDNARLANNVWVTDSILTIDIKMKNMRSCSARHAPFLKVGNFREACRF